MANQWIDKNHDNRGGPNVIEWVPCDRRTYLAHRDAGHNCAEFSGAEFPVHMQLCRVSLAELKALIALIEAE